MSTFQVLKADIAATQRFVEAAALAAATLLEQAESAVQTFERITPHASHHPQAGQVSAQLQELTGLAQQAHGLSLTLYHAVEEVDGLFT